MRGPELNDPKRKQWLIENELADVFTPAGRHVTVALSFMKLGSKVVQDYLQSYDDAADAALQEKG